MATNKFGVGVRKMMIFPLKTEPDNSVPTYDPALEIGDTNAIKASPSTANATADGDDKQVANISMTTGWTVEWTGWGVPAETAGTLYGHKLTGTSTKQVDEKMEDIAPYVGIGYLRTMADKTNTKTFMAYYYYKAQAVQGDEESNSGGSSLNLAATNVTFNAIEPSFGPTRSYQEFDTEEAAVEWIKTKAGQAS